MSEGVLRDGGSDGRCAGGRPATALELIRLRWFNSHYQTGLRALLIPVALSPRFRRPRHPAGICDGAERTDGDAGTSTTDRGRLSARSGSSSVPDVGIGVGMQTQRHEN